MKRCIHCGGNILGQSCLMCSRPVTPERVSLRDALANLAEPDASPYCGSRQQIPLSVSLERARRWSRGETAE